jgi:hypothetical protein
VGKKKQQPGGLALDTGHTQPLSYRKMGGSTARQLSVNARKEPAAVEAAGVARRKAGNAAKPPKPKNPLYDEIRSHLTASGRLRRRS